MRSFPNLTAKISPVVRARAEQAEKVVEKKPEPGHTFALYQDAMDPTRFLSPVKESKSGTLCRVYWDNRKVKETLPGASDLLFGGTATLPTSLFLEERSGYKSYIGFLRVK